MGEFTKAEFEAWIPITEVYENAKAAWGESYAQQTIMGALSAGLLKARANHWYDGKHTLSGPSDFRFEQEIAPNFWGIAEGDEGRPLFSLALWTTGNVEIHTTERKSGIATRVIHKLYGIRLEPKGVAELLPQKAPSTPNPVPADMIPVMALGEPDAAPLPRVKHAGGAPPKSFWESVFVEIAARLYNGDLKPQKLRELEDAIVEVVMSLDESVGEATARRHAKPLWDKIKPGS